MTDAHADTRWSSWTWIGAIWCAGALIDTSQAIFIMHAGGGGKARFLPFVIYFLTWLPWAVATPFIIKLARRWPIAGAKTLKATGRHLLAFFIISALAEVWSASLLVFVNPWHRQPPPLFVRTWSTLLGDQILVFAIAYALILTLTYVVDSHAKVARQATEAARLNEELSKAQLDALRRQMDPHFMFNTLNSIAGLVYDERRDAAVSMIVGLSEFLRRASEDSHRAQVSLQEEVEYLQRYLDIQKVRFAERLRVSLDIPDELLKVQVPNLLLQPLVENAIKHGVSKRISGGLIRVSATRLKGALRLIIYNDGAFVQDELEAVPGRVGLGNLRTRLKILHGDESELLLRPAEGGVEVIVTLPLKEE